MKKVLSIFLLLLSFLPFKNIAYAQREIDACWTFIKAGDYKRAIKAGKLAVKKYPKNPKAYVCLGSAYYKVGELNLALENLKKAESLTSNKKVLLAIYSEIGMVMYRMGYLDDALSYFNRSLSLAKDLGDTDMQTNMQNIIAKIYEDKLDKSNKNIAYAKREVDACLTFIDVGDYKRAIEVGKIAVKKYPMDSLAYSCLGSAYYKVGEFKLALENMKKAESLTSNKKHLMDIYNTMGLILDSMGSLDDALLYYSRSLSLAKDLVDTKMQAVLLNNIAGIYGKKGELDKALIYYEESLSLTTNEKDKAPTYNNMAIIYYVKGDWQKAIKYYQKVVEIFEKYGDYHSVSIVKLNIGEVYRRIGDYKNAEKYLFEGLEGVKKVGDKLGEATGYGSLGFFYKDKGDKKTAREYLIRAYNLYKSIGAEKEAQGILEEIKELDKSN